MRGERKETRKRKEEDEDDRKKGVRENFIISLVKRIIDSGWSRAGHS